MKFSKFGRRISDSLFILPQPGNIVKRFFQLFLKKFFSTRLPLIGDSLIILSYSILIVKPIFYFFLFKFPPVLLLLFCMRHI